MAFTRLDPLLLTMVDAVFAAIPWRRPTLAELTAARIYSHRGERDDKTVLEDSFAAYDPLIDSGVSGLECDVRFSRDGVPMVFHDADLLRLYSCRERIADLDCAELQRRFPLIPTLRELAERYAGKLEFMIEFKAEPRPNPQAQVRAVAEALAGLEPQRDYHLMSLDCDTLIWLSGLPGNALVPIARSNVKQMSTHARQHGCPALTGHYALLDRRSIREHRAAGRAIGLGFPASRGALCYSLSAGAQWLFSNTALSLQNQLDALLDSARNSSST